METAAEERVIKDSKSRRGLLRRLIVGVPLAALIAIGALVAIQHEAEPDSSSGFAPPAHCADVRPDRIQPGTDFCSPDAFLN